MAKMEQAFLKEEPQIKEEMARMVKLQQAFIKEDPQINEEKQDDGTIDIIEDVDLKKVRKHKQREYEKNRKNTTRSRRRGRNFRKHFLGCRVFDEVLVSASRIRTNGMQLRKSVQQILDLQDKLCIMTAARNEAVKQLDATRKALRASEDRAKALQQRLQVESYVPQTPPRRKTSRKQAAD
eukprot:s1383_g4.t1